MAYQVVFAATARKQTREVQLRWRAHRRAAPELFKQELRGAVKCLAELPLGVPLVEVVLPRTRYHLYFTVYEADQRVEVLAVWHTARGQLPPL